MTAESDLVNGWPGGIIQAGRDRLFVTPTYHVNQLYNAHRGRDRLKVVVSGPTFDTSKEGTGVPVLDAVASRSADGSEIYVKAVNTSPTDVLDTEIDLRGLAVRPEGEWHVLTAPSLDTHNSFARPDEVQPRREPLNAGSRFRVTLPPRSVSVIVLRTVNSGRR
jgi:alpha-N-arabinofuranosidase